ncbi:hypothetical protein VTN96DRAFT_10228 [Rasamsonia emersonii]
MRARRARPFGAYGYTVERRRTVLFRNPLLDQDPHRVQRPKPSADMEPTGRQQEQDSGVDGRDAANSRSGGALRPLGQERRQRSSNSGGPGRRQADGRLHDAPNGLAAQPPGPAGCRCPSRRIAPSVGESVMRHQECGCAWPFQPSAARLVVSPSQPGYTQIYPRGLSGT